MNWVGVKSGHDPCKQRGRNRGKIGLKSDRNRRFSENDVNTAKTTCKYAVRNYIYIYVVYIYIMGSRMVRPRIEVHDGATASWFKIRAVYKSGMKIR
jgi:hypothetical protein